MIKQERKMKKIPRVCRQGIKLEIPELFIAIYPRHHLPLSYNNLLATNVSRFSPPCTFPTPSSDSNCLFPATEKLLKIFLPQNDLTSVGLLLFLFQIWRRISSLILDFISWFVNSSSSMALYFGELPYKNPKE